nr:alpha/beta hydrolase [Clostridioides difficile]
MSDIFFKKGLYQLNQDPNFNFQLNRVIMWDGGRLEDVQKVASQIVDSASWKEQLTQLAKIAEMEKRTDNAIAYYRMSEFFMYDSDTDKKTAYTKATTLFYEYYSEYFSNGRVQYFHVPYENITLPVMFSKAQGRKIDTILLHGGNDSYFEELFFPMLYLSAAGFDVYLFEGPGQGGVLRIQGKTFTYKWEQPVKSILDYFDLSGITIIGASLGGYLAPRAAAFDNRISRVVAWSVFPNFLDVVIGSQPKKLQILLRLLLKYRAKRLINLIVSLKMKRGNSFAVWGIKHGMYAYGAVTPYEYFKKIDDYSLAPIGDKITQDILILGASQDHFVDYRMIWKEVSLLPNVQSLTFRLMTEQEEASNHCNCGNTKLVLDTMINWISMMKQEKI